MFKQLLLIQISHDANMKILFEKKKIKNILEWKRNALSFIFFIAKNPKRKKLAVCSNHYFLTSLFNTVIKSLKHKKKEYKD